MLDDFEVKIDVNCWYSYNLCIDSSRTGRSDSPSPGSVNAEFETAL